jgi:hypothetical protein
VATPNFLDGYELANDTIRRFWDECPMGRLATTIIETLSNLEKGYVTIKAEVYRDFADLVPAATGYAYGNVATMTPSMKKWLIEDTETSCLARGIKTLSPSAGSRASVENMMQVEGLKLVPDMPIGTLEVQVSEARDPWSFGAAVESMATQIITGTTPDAAPLCDHGSARLWKEGESSRGKYAGWVCAEKSKERQCKAQWLTLSADGKWL